jgi:hypothetical protein
MDFFHVEIFRNYSSTIDKLQS